MTKNNNDDNEKLAEVDEEMEKEKEMEKGEKEM